MGDVICTKWLKNALHLKLYNMARQEWHSDVSENQLCLNYRIFKNEIDYCNYLNVLDK